MLSYYKGSHIKALVHLYPDIGIDRKKFKHAPQNYWLAAHNRRAFFDNFAKLNGFDPLVPANWHKIKYDQIRSTKHGSSVLRYYNNSHIPALLDLYPDLGLDKLKFRQVSKNYWMNVDNRLKFFMRFANEKGFEPLVPENWYSMSVRKIRSIKGGSAVLQYYKTFPHALLHLFPNIGLDITKFTILPPTKHV